MQCFQSACLGGNVEICLRDEAFKEKSWIKLHLSNGILTLQCVMATVHLKDWIIQRTTENLSLKKRKVPPTYGNLLRTAHATWLHREINPRCLPLSLFQSDTAVAADKHYLVCDHVRSVIPAPSLLLQNKSKWSRLCRHSRLSHDVTLCQASMSVLHLLHLSQKTQGNVSLLTSSVCLAASLIAGVCSGEMPAQSVHTLPTSLILLHQGRRESGSIKHASLCLAFPGTYTNTNTSQKQSASSCTLQWVKHCKSLLFVLNRFYKWTYMGPAA